MSGPPGQSLQQRQEERDRRRREYLALERAILERAGEPGRAFLDSLTSEERRHIAALEAVREGNKRGYRLLGSGQAVLATVHRAQAEAGELPGPTCDAVLAAQARRERRLAKRRIA